jgi:hypothetical protein
MPFSFLNPWLWLGALAIGIPIYLHMRRRQEKNLLRFSAVRFLADNPEPRRSPLRLQDVLLFTLRALALILLVCAFTWPYLKGPDTVPIKESRVYILDNTLSHQAENGFARARDKVAAEIAGTGENIQVAVIELASNPRAVVAFGDERRTAAQSVREIEPSFQRGSYLAAFRMANTMLANSLGLQKRIVFHGDDQQNQWKENVSTPPFLRNIPVEAAKPATGQLANLGVHEPRVQRIFLGEKSLIHFSAKLIHSGEAASANVSLHANGQTILNRKIDLTAQPETILLQAQWEADPSSWLRGDLAVDGKPDALPGDNRVFFSLPPVVEGKVALLAQSTYLRLALSPEVMRGEWAAKSLDPANLGPELNNAQDADVLCLESNFLQGGDARKLLWRYLTNGRGVVLFVNRLTPTIKGFLRELGFDADQAPEGADDSGEKFQFVFSNHPIFHPFLSPDYGNLMEVKVLHYVRLTASQAMPLVFSEKGAALFFQGTKFPGKLFVAAFGMDRQHTSWPVHQTFIPFLDLTLQSARADDPTPTNFEPGEVTVLPIPGGSAAREVILSADGREWSRSSIVQGRVELRLPGKPGLYDLALGEKDQLYKVLSVNPSPKESELVYADPEDSLKSWRLSAPGDAARVKANPPAGAVSVSAILQQRLWWWMLLGALLALGLEALLGAVRRKAHA